MSGMMLALIRAKLVTKTGAVRTGKYWPRVKPTQGASTRRVATGNR